MCQCFEICPIPPVMAKTKVGKGARKEFGDGIMAGPSAEEVNVTPPESEAEGTQGKGEKRKRAFTKVTDDERRFLEALLEQYDPKKASKY